MRRILICTGVLGGGTALTFAAAALAATLLPGGTIVPSNNVLMAVGGPVMVKGGVAVPMPVTISSGGGSISVAPAPPAVDLPASTPVAPDASPSG